MTELEKNIAKIVVLSLHLKTPSLIHSKFCAPKQPLPKQICLTPGRKVDNGLTRPFRQSLHAKNKAKATNTKPTQKRYTTRKRKNTHTHTHTHTHTRAHQTRAGLGEVGPKEKAKITKGDLNDRRKTGNQENTSMMRTTFKM